MSDSNLIVKAAGSKGQLLKNLLINAAGGAGHTVFWDQFIHSKDPNNKLSDTFRSFTPEGFKEDSGRTYMNALNMLLGSAGTKFLRQGTVPKKVLADIDNIRQTNPAEAKYLSDQADKLADKNFKLGFYTSMGIPTKDLIISGTGLSQNVNKNIQNLVDAANRVDPPKTEFSTKDKLIAAALGAGALGLGAYGISRLGRGLDEKSQLANAGRVTLTLPTKDPKDAETQVSIPLSDVGVSAKTYQQLGRDVRRRLRSESKERQRKYIEAIELGMEPAEAGLLKASGMDKKPASFLAGSHIKTIAKEHAPEVPEAEQPEVEEEPKTDLKPLNTKLSEQNKKLSEQDKRIKQLEKYLGQVNGNKLSRVRDNLRGISKTAYAPSIQEVNSTPEAFGTKGGVMYTNIFKPHMFGRAGDQLYKQIRPFVQQIDNPFIQKLFGYTKANPNAIVPIGPV